MQHRGRSELREENSQSSPYKKKDKQIIQTECQHWGFQHGRCYIGFRI
jgi:hypothetical protein